MLLSLGIVKITFKTKKVDIVNNYINDLNPLTRHTELNMEDTASSLIAVRTDELVKTTDILTKCLLADTIIQLETWLTEVEV